MNTNILLILVQILGISALGNLLAERALPFQIIKKKLKLDKRELFNCPTCLTFHISWILFLIMSFSPSTTYIINIILFSSLSSFMAHVVWKHWNKF